MVIAVAWLCFAGAQTASAASAGNALILGDSVSAAPSLEQQQAEADGFTVTVVDGTTWDAMTAAQFRSYRVLIIGDPFCGDEGNFAAAVANKTTWEPVVMGSGGNKVLIGTDPTFHSGSHPGAVTLEKSGIAFAGAVAGATGAYIDLTCAYTSSAPATPVPLLDGLSSHGSGQFTVGGAPCTGDISIVAASGPTAGLHHDDLSNWSCSVHEFFDKFPSDYTVLAMAIDPSVPDTYGANDVDTGARVTGSPYILVSGGGVVISSSITLTPATATNPIGTSHTVTATIKNGTTPVPGKVVTFNVDSGPNTGKTGTGTTNASGQTTFTYTGTGGVGTDSISATYSNDGVLEKATATKTWTSTGEGPPPTVSIVTPPNGATYTFHQVVNASYSCADTGGPGISTCTGPVASGSPIDTSTVGVHTFKVDALALDGKTASATNSYTVTAPPPTVTITTPPNGATYVYHQVVHANYACADTGGPGIATCTGPVANNGLVDTNSVGTHTFTVNATAKDGQTATKTNTYTVIKAATSLSPFPLIVKLQTTPNLFVFVRVGIVSATLTSGSPAGPVAGKLITFAAGGQFLCNGVTQANGTATCTYHITSILAGILNLGYNAYFAGDANLLPSVGHAPLAQVGGLSLF